jgi:hypothetical protein
MPKPIPDSWVETLLSYTATFTTTPVKQTTPLKPGVAMKSEYHGAAILNYPKRRLGLLLGITSRSPTPAQALCNPTLQNDGSGFSTIPCHLILGATT